MKIQAVKIDGFKNLSDIVIHFNNITALVSLNNFGKSNVLMAIDFGLSFIKSSLDDKTKMMSNLNLIPLNQTMVGRNFRFEMEITFHANDHDYRMIYGYEFSWKYNEKVEPCIIKEFLKIKYDEKGQKYNKFISRNKNEAFYKSSETGRCSTKINVQDNELVINKLCAYDHLYYLDIILRLNNMRFYMENNFDAKSFYQPNPFIQKDLEDIMINAINLPRVIYQLKETYPDKFLLLKDVYSQLFPEVEDLIVNQYELTGIEKENIPENAPFVLAHSIYVLFVKNKYIHQPINFQAMSDGAKRVFMILTKVILSSVSNISLIAIEEPENSVHPSLFQSYIRIISQLLNGCKIIITSHSPYIINYLDPSWLHIGINRTPGVAEFFMFKKSGERLLQKDAEAFKMNMGDYLFLLLSDPDNNLDDYLEYERNE
mgnify:CR=1 FL=1